MAPKKTKKALGRKAMKKTKGGIIAVLKTSPAITDGTSQTILPAIQQAMGDGSVRTL
jgi:hypothetical protein